MAARRTGSRGRPSGPAGKAGPRRRGRRGESRFAWLGTLAVGVVLIVGGFASGVVLGVVTEEPTVLTEAWSQGAERVALREARTEPERGPVQAAPTLPSADPQAAPASQVVAIPPVERVPTRSARPVATPRDPGRLPSVSAPPAGFAVQVGAFGSSDAARAMRGKLEGAGYESFVSAGAASRDRRWRVRVGPFPTRAGAERAAARLEQRDGLATWIVALENEG